MSAILIIEANTPQKVAHGVSGAASFVRTLSALDPDVMLSVVNPYEHPIQSDNFDGFDGVVFTGSGEAWAADAPDAAPQRSAMEKGLEAGLPIWGSCNGMNLAALVLGGELSENPNGIEAGLAENLQVTYAGLVHPMMAGRLPGFDAPCIHRDHVSRLPSEAQLIAFNDHTSVQAMVYETGSASVWATQYHPEASLADIAAYMRDQGIFGHLSGLADKMERAENPTLEERSRELMNWLWHVEQHRAASAGKSADKDPALA